MKALFKAMAAGLALVFFAGVGACAQNVGDINRVQPNFVRKADFAEGEWYIRQTVADVPPMAALAFVGLQLDMEKVRWEITESHLLAFRSHERFPGLNPMVDHDAKEIGDTPYLEGADDGHYNDFYKDAPVAAYRIVGHFDIQRMYNTSTGEQTNVIVENASDRPWYEREYMRVDWSANQIRHYTADIGRGGWLDFAQYIPEDVGGDWAFRMETRGADGEWVDHVVDPTREDYDADRHAEYIDFTTRLFVAPPTIAFAGRLLPACYLIAGTYDCTSAEVKVRTSILRVPEEQVFHPRVYDDHEMMKFGFFRTERMLFNRRQGQTDQGRLRFANIHNIWENAYDAQGNLLPYERRTPKPIYYTLSPNYPEELIPAAEQMARNWSRALARAVAGAQGHDLEIIEAQFPTDEGGQYVNRGLYRLNYNEDGKARIGDLRHNFIYWVDNPQLSSPLGYGPSSADPETGEIISGQAFVYGAAVDRYAQHAMDVVDALMGEYDIDDISSGADVRRFMEEHIDRVDPRGLHFHGPDHLHHEIGQLHIDELRLENLRPEKHTRLEAIRQIGLDDPLFEGRSQRMKRLEGTPFEAMMINDEIRASLPTPDLARSPITQEVIDASRPFTTGLVDGMHDEKLRMDWASKHCVWLQEFADPSVFGLAQFIKGKIEDEGWSREDAYQYLREAIYASVMDHEIGHTMGLRHNFQGTFDSINYFDEYWNQRRENLNQNPVTYDHLDEMASLTQNQLEGRMREYQYSSIMDYSGRFSSDTKGLGRYDEAAVIFAYGEAVEVFETVGNQFRTRYFEQYSGGASRFENRGSPAYPHLLDTTHYTRIPFMMGDGNMNEGLQRMRTRRLVPYEVVRSMRDPSHPQHTNRWAEVPYMFCSDEQVGTHASCHRWLEGADVWEQARFLMDSWQNYYWFSNFRRHRWGWQASSVLNRSYSRYFAYLPNFYQHWLWGIYIGREVDEQLQQIYMQNAAIEGVNFLSNVLATPSYGSYELDPISNTYELISYNQLSSSDLYLPRGPLGRRPSSTYDWQAGYYYYWYQQEAGHFWDYLAALFALSESEATVLGVDTQADFQSFWIPYYLVFSDDLDRVYNGIFSEDHRAFAPRLIDGELVHRPMVDLFGLYEEDDPFITDQPVVAPYHTSSNQFYTMIYGMLGFVTTLDLSFADQNKIFRLGSGESVTAGNGFELVTFENPFTGITYAALHEIDGEPTGAVRMVQKANAAKERWENDEADSWEVSRIVDWMEVQRGLSNIFGSAF
jgi:hypothetical protein